MIYEYQSNNLHNKFFLCLNLRFLEVSNFSGLKFYVRIL